MMPVSTWKRREKVSWRLRRMALASVTSQCGVSVEGFIRPWTEAVHSATNQVRGLPA